jgi:hypothetical protein
LSIPYQSPDKGTSLSCPDKYCMDYSPHNPNTKSANPTVFTDEEVLARFSRYTIADEDSFIPEKMEIRESKGRKSKEDTRRIVFLRKGRLHYKVLKFPTANTGTRAVDKEVDEDISMS